MSRQAAEKFLPPWICLDQLGQPQGSQVPMKNLIVTPPAQISKGIFFAKDFHPVTILSFRF